MAYASRSGRARTSSSSPQAHAICDRCGFRYNHSDLVWQHDWRGATQQNLRILVCRTCRDVPQEQQRAIVVPADPMPIMQPRTQDFLAAETDYHTVTGGESVDPVTGIPIPNSTTFVTSNGTNRTEIPVGIPSNLDINAVMPLFEGSAYRVPISPLSVVSNGADQVTVTCSTPHGLTTGAQIVVQGLSNARACGAYAITVTSATAFTYQTYYAIPVAPLLTGSTLMVTAHIGAPYGYSLGG